MVSGGNNFTLKVASGTIIQTNGTGTLAGGTLDFGATEGFILGNNNLNVNTVLTGSGGLTDSDTGTVALGTVANSNGSFNGNTYTGTTTQNAGNLLLGSVGRAEQRPREFDRRQLGRHQHQQPVRPCQRGEP